MEFISKLLPQVIIIIYNTDVLGYINHNNYLAHPFLKKVLRCPILGAYSMLGHFPLTMHLYFYTTYFYSMHVSNKAKKCYWFVVCLRYFELTLKKAKPAAMFVVGGKKAGVNEFPHMVGFNIYTRVQTFMNIISNVFITRSCWVMVTRWRKKIGDVEVLW